MHLFCLNSYSYCFPFFLYTRRGEIKVMHIIYFRQSFPFCIYTKGRSTTNSIYILGYVLYFLSVRTRERNKSAIIIILEFYIVSDERTYSPKKNIM